MSAIDDKYTQLGGPGGFLGRPFDAGAGSGEMDTADRRGRFRDFERGTIYWTATTGAHEVHGDIRLKWARLGGGRSFLGYPLTDETGTPNRRGRFNHFEHGSIYWTPTTGAHEVHGAIRDKWASLGWERSRLGFPTSDEKAVPNSRGRISEFEGGVIVWTPEGGAQVRVRIDDP
ncbi:LGFP repeat [Luteitalea pratensis]|uniref:LGFP repeat n=1 Tax=Luteitalea pratensis TaxID=1855912 RepID=A0A143PJC5_LUTPR|nr:hypothetical protein [Luteitalea pratensis]AMY08667.1 LGFP repeat [Luteitalea pratensis]